MSIESLLKDLTEAVRENTAALQGQGGGKSSKTESKPQTPSKSTGSKGSSKKKVTVDTLAEKAGEYLGANPSGAAKKAAIANMKKLNDKFGVDRITKADEDDYEEIVSILDQLISGENPFEDDEEEGDEDDSLV